MSSPITIPAGAIDGLVAKAIIDSLSEETKATIISSAVNYLLTQPQTDRYDKNKKGDSPLQIAFNEAVRKLSDEVAAEVVVEAKPQIVTLLKDLLNDVDTTLLDEEHELPRRLMGTIIAVATDQAFEKWRR